MDRHENMRRIKGKNTQPEVLVRALLRELGYPGYRLHRRELPGQPDVAFIGRRKAIFVHGCFWHGHDCRKGRRKPKSNADYWVPKIERNRQRDVKDLAELERLGWDVRIVWECDLAPKNRLKLRAKLLEFMVSTKG